MLLDTREKISPQIFPDAARVALEYGDIEISNAVIEIKIEQDLLNFNQLLKELEKLECCNKPVHIVYISHSSKYFSILVEQAVPRGFFPHYLKTLAQLPDLVKKIEKDNFLKTKWAKRSPGLSIKEKLIYGIPGMNAKDAKEIAKLSLRTLTEEDLKKIRVLKSGKLPKPFQILMEVLK